MTQAHIFFCQGHEVTSVTDAGAFVTKCQNLIRGGIASEEEISATCTSCLTWDDEQKEEEDLVPKKKTGHTRKPTGRPQYRPHRSKEYVTKESLTFAAKAVMAAVEWYNRGGENQFTEEMLDQVNLAQRFCAEILLSHGRAVGTVGKDDD